jgi:nucleotide-binding universal stress UspA family protein
MTVKIERIIVGIDFSEESEIARIQARNIAQRCGAEMTLLHIFDVPDYGPVSDNLGGEVAATYHHLALEQRAKAIERLDRLCEPLNTQGLTALPLALEGTAKKLLPKVAAEHKADLVVIGTHGRTGFRRIRLGSVATATVRHTPCSVLVARPRATGARGYNHILVPTDFTESAETALMLATSLVSSGGVIDVLHLWHGPFDGSNTNAVDSYRRAMAANTEQRASQLIALARERHRKINFYHREAPPVRGILDVVEPEGIELVVMGSHTRRGLKRWLMGSVAENVVRHAPCSVLVTRSERSPGSG